MTLSKETIGNVIGKLEHFAQNLKWTDVRGAQDLLAAAEGLRELLERREREKQKPVYQCMEDGNWYDTEKRLYEEVKENGNMCRILYAAPPAPVVPEELLTAMEEVLRISDRQHDAWDKAKAAITTLRAAPQSFGNSEQLNSPAVPDCWCRTCRPVNMADMRFVICPDCGNKRCPKANDHRNTCSGNNESGQDGSAYPVAPKQESE